MALPTNFPDHDLNPVERELAAWQPATEGLNADAFLYAAGKAAARPGANKVIWPLLACTASLLAIILAGRFASERSERLALLHELQDLRFARAVPAPTNMDSAQASETIGYDSQSRYAYFTARQRIQEGLDAWVEESAPDAGKPTPAPEPEILEVWHSRQALSP